MTLVELAREAGVEDIRADVRRALRVADRRIEVLRRKRAMTLLRRDCCSCGRPCQALTCDPCRGFVPWELRVQWREADREQDREDIARQATEWIRQFARGILPFKQLALGGRKRRVA